MPYKLAYNAELEEILGLQTAASQQETAEPEIPSYFQVLFETFEPLNGDTIELINGIILDVSESGSISMELSHRKIPVQAYEIEQGKVELEFQESYVYTITVNNPGIYNPEEIITRLYLDKRGEEILGIQSHISTAESAGAKKSTDSDDWGFNWTVVITGMLIVFALLTVLIAVMGGFGSIMHSLNQKKKTEEPHPEPDSGSITEPVFAANNTDKKTSDADGGEIAAVISAAVAMFEQETGNKGTAVSISGAGSEVFGNTPHGTARTSQWAAAGRLQNTGHRK